MAFKYRLGNLFVFLFGLVLALKHKHFALSPKNENPPDTCLNRAG